jgi:hypothetical protein
MGGFGWDYPPGTPPASVYADEMECAECGESRSVRIVTELGATWIEPEETPCCGAEWKEEK